MTFGLLSRMEYSSPQEVHMGNGETGLGQSSRGISGWAVAILWLITFVLGLLGAAFS